MADHQLRRCQPCGYVFGPVQGSVKLAALFEDVPADWFCWISAADKDDFMLHDDVEV